MVSDLVLLIALNLFLLLLLFLAAFLCGWLLHASEEATRDCHDDTDEFPTLRGPWHR
jgi:hypothetical protein